MIAQSPREAPSSLAAFVKNWFDEDIADIQPISSGTTCDAYRVTTACGACILRGQATRHQADQEAAIAEALRGTNIAASILPSRSGAYTLAREGRFYNMQSCLPGKPPDFSDERQIEAAALSTATLHKALSRAACSVGMHDHFSTLSLLHRARPMLALDALFPSDAKTES